MSVEELLKLLKESGLEDAQINDLLQQAIQVLGGAVEGEQKPEEPIQPEEDEKVQASKLLGVSL